MAEMKYCQGPLCHTYQTKDRIYKLEGEKWQTVHKGKNITSLAFANNSIIVGTTDGYYTINRLTGKTTSE